MLALRRKHLARQRAGSRSAKYSRYSMVQPDCRSLAGRCASSNTSSAFAPGARRPRTQYSSSLTGSCQFASRASSSAALLPVRVSLRAPSVWPSAHRHEVRQFLPAWLSARRRRSSAARPSWLHSTSALPPSSPLLTAMRPLSCQRICASTVVSRARCAVRVASSSRRRSGAQAARPSALAINS